MIEAVMFYALGILSAGIVALLVGPPFWRRAVRLTYRAIEQTLPMTEAEIQADKDQLRAVFAVEVRRLEATIERLDGQAATQRIELNHKREIITHLHAEGSLSAADRIGLIKQRDELVATLAARDQALSEAGAAAASAERRFAEIETRLVEAKGAIEAMVGDRETQRMEVIARDTELDNLRDSVAAVKTTSTVGEIARAGLETGMSELRASLALERRRVEEAAEFVAKIEARRATLAGEVESRDAALAALRGELAQAEARNETMSLRVVEAEAAGMSLIAIKEGRAETESRLARLEAENARLEADLAEARAANTGPDPQEMQRLRGKLVEIGGAVARLASRSEGLSVVPALPPPAEINGTASDPQLELTPISLAERIRALQHASGGF